MKEDRGLQVDTTGEQPLFVRDFHTPANARPGMLSPLNARGPYSPVPTHLRKQYVEKMYEIFQLADETHSGVAELKKCLHIAEHQFAKEVVTLNHEHYAFSYEKLLTFDEFMIIADEVIPMRELYFFVISGDLFDDRDEKVEEITSGLAHVPEKEHAELVKNAAPLTKSGKEKLVKVSIEDLSALPLHYGVERYDCAKCGITAENMMANCIFIFVFYFLDSIMTYRDRLTAMPKPMLSSVTCYQ